jgi:hypothetical protein
MAFVGKCAFCGLDVTATNVAHPVTGWVPQREQGGANRIIDRQEDRSVVAHVKCAEQAAWKRRHGVSEAQGELIA